MEGREELQRLADLVSMNRNRSEEIAIQLDRVESVIQEHRTVIASLQAIDTSEQGHIPIGGGVMLPFQKFEDSTLVDLGSGVFAEKTFGEAINLIQQRIQDLENALSRLEEEAQSTTKMAQDLSHRFSETAEQISKNEPEKDTKQKESNTKRQRRKFGKELTLDD